MIGSTCCAKHAAEAVIEAEARDLDLVRAVLAEVGSIADPKAVLASVTQRVPDQQMRALYEGTHRRRH